MAELKFTIPDARMPDLVAAWGSDWQETIDGQPNPETQTQYAKRQIRDMIAMRVDHHFAVPPPAFPIT